MLPQVVMICAAAAVFAVSADALHVLVLTSVGLLASLVVRRPVRFYDRSIIYSCVVALVLSVGGDYVVKIDEDRFGLIAGLGGAKTSVPLLLYAAVAATFFRTGAYSLGIVAACTLVAMLFGGDLGGAVRQNPKASLLTPCVKHFDLFFACCLSLAFAMMTAGLVVASRGMADVERRRCGTKAAVVRLAGMCLAALLTLGALLLYNRYESELRKIENFFLRAGGRFARTGSEVVFNKNVDLNRTISLEIERNAALVVLRAVSPKPPGYLRGRAYGRYLDGRWEVEGGESVKLPASEAGGALAFKTFRLRPGASRVREADDSARKDDRLVSIYPSKGFKSDVLLVPGGADAFELVADTLSADRNGVLTPDAWEKDGGCVAHVGSETVDDSACAEPRAPQEEALYVDVPTVLAETLDRTLADIYPDSPSSDGESATMLTRFFHDTFTYSLKQTPPEEGVDPVTHFLMRTRSGHCELFATAAVLLLRRQGIPARYVTGFVCQERHPSGRYYVSRLGDAHAWVEAFDRQRGAWALVEPTPPTGVPNFKTQWGMLESWTDWLKQIFQKAFADARRGHFAEFIVSIVSGAWAVLCKLLWHPLRGVIAILCLVAVTWWWRGRRVRREGVPDAPELLRLQRELARLERLVASKGGGHRRLGETLDEWARRISADSAGRFAAVPMIVETYARFRYRSAPPLMNAADEFRSIVESTWRSSFAFAPERKEG